MRELISFLLICVALTTHARQITADEAAAIASEFLNSSASVQKAPARVNVRRAKAKDTFVSSEANQPYYVFNADGNNGFVIISGDDRAKKIIGYSDRGNFDMDNMPPQLAAILGQYTEQFSKLTSNVTDPSWTGPARATSDDEGVLLQTANWDQGYPFNLMTPENCVTGCVPTSVAIIMRFHKWPEKGLGNTSFESNGHTVSFDFDHEYFDWDSMPLDYIEGQYTEYQALEVSKVMYAAGNAVHAGYGQYETYASLPAYGMYRYLKFEVPKRDVVIHDALELCLNKFLQTIRSEITASRPMLLDISAGINVDHFVVADGFDSQNNVHLNYGWGGSANGFYNPDVIISYLNYFYSNITPDRKATNDREEILPDDGALSNTNTGGPLHSGLVILGEIKPNEDFGFTYHIAFPIEPLPNFKLGLLHMSSQGSIKDILWSDTLDLSLQNGEGQSWTSITKDIEDDDRVTLAYKKEETDEWHIIKDTPNAKASISVTARERDYLKFSIVSDSGVDLSVGPFAIIEDQKDLWNYSGKIEKCYFNLCASVNETFSLGSFSLHNNIGCTSISINGLEIGQVNFNYLNYVPYVETTISDISNLMPYLSDSINIEVKKYLYDEMLTITKHVEKAGTLHQLFKNDDARITRSLTLTGQIDWDDLKFLENQCPFLQVLDMSEANLIEEILPCNSYYRSTKMLQQIKLPCNLKSIETESFMGESGHGGIRIVYVPAGVEEIGERAFMLGEISSVVMANPKPIDVRGLHNAPFRHASAIYVPKGSKSTYENYGWGQYWNGEFYERKIIEYEGDFIPMDSLSFSPEIITMKIGESLSIHPIIHPSNSTEQWTGYLRKHYLDGEIINLIDNECIEAIREGCSLITANHSNFYAHLLVNVIPQPILAESLTLDPTSWCVEEGTTFQISAIILPENTTDKTLQWMSSDNSIATVDSTGLVSVLKEGRCSITASTIDGSNLTAECQLDVLSGIEEVFADKDSVVDVYNTQGSLIKKNCTKEDLQRFASGIYLIRSSSTILKVLIK